MTKHTNVHKFPVRTAYDSEFALKCKPVTPVALPLDDNDVFQILTYMAPVTDSESQVPA